MCNTRPLISRTPEMAKEMGRKVHQYVNPIAHNPLQPEDLTGTLKKVSVPSLRQHIIAPIPRDHEGIRYGGCDF